MNWKWASRFVFGAAAAAAVAFSGCGNANSIHIGGGGNATFAVTITDAMPANTSITSFVVTISGITADPTSGSSVSLLSAPATVDLVRLQADDLFVSSTSITAGSYASVTVTLANPVVTFVNRSGSTISGCANGAVCKVAVAASGSVKLATSPFPLTLTENQKTGVRLDFNFANAISVSGGNLAVNFAQAGVLSAAVLPQGNPPSGESDFVSDYLGVVTAVNASSKTVTLSSLTLFPAQVTATVNSNTVFDNFTIAGSCPSPSLSCVATGQVLSADLSVNSDGTLTASEIEFEDTAADDELEGVVTSVNAATQFSMAVTGKIQANSSLIGSVAVGDPVIVNLQINPAFAVDEKGLAIPVGPLGLFQGSSDTSVMVPGEVVQVRVKTFSLPPAPASAIVAVDRVRLRFSRFTATVSGGPTPPFFDITNLPPFFALGIVQVETFPLQTHFEGVTDASGLADAQTVSLRALYINAAPPFYALSVRKH